MGARHVSKTARTPESHETYAGVASHDARFEFKLVAIIVCTEKDKTFGNAKIF